MKNKDMMYNLKKELINLISRAEYRIELNEPPFQNPHNIKRHAKGLLKTIEKEEKKRAVQEFKVGNTRFTSRP